MTTPICIPIPTRESIAYALASLLERAFCVPEPEVFWYTYVNDSPEKVQGILSHFGAKHPEEMDNVKTIKEALTAVTEDELAAVAKAAEAL